MQYKKAKLSRQNSWLGTRANRAGLNYGLSVKTIQGTNNYISDNKYDLATHYDRQKY